MTDLAKISVVFAVILILLRKKFNIGIAMIVAGSLLFLLYLMPLALILKTVKHAVSSGATIKLILALSFIRAFEKILREHDVLAGMMGAVKAVFRNRKLVAVSMPLLIGLIPSVGGAYFSAPMVAETTMGINMSPEEKGFINYWFRHPWEYVLPLYPGILLASAVSGIELHRLITVNLSYALLIVITGFVFAMRGIKGSLQTGGPPALKSFLSFVPILAVLTLVVAFHLELYYALLAVVTTLLLFYRYSFKSALAAFKHGFSMDIIILILGVMFFKEAMETSGAVKNLSLFFMKEGIPAAPVLFMLPFITGLLTGITIGFVGSTFPLIVSIAGTPSASAVSFAFAAGFLGVLLSPLHICLILTREYFKADLWGIYKLMIPGCIIILCGAIVQYMILQ
jgi:integral membrane protein (TIGR00529 family)